MKRPLLLRLLPNSLKETLYYRNYATRHHEYRELFTKAPLALAPEVSMHGLILGDVISGNIAFNGFYELGLSLHMVELARKGGTLVDVGANMGYFSLLWTGINPSARAVAFEASPRNCAIIERNLKENRATDRVTLVSKAAGNKAGMVTFDIGPAEQTGWGGISSGQSATSITVPMVRLDEELPDRPIAVLKIDVEGADTWVLQGCENLLRNRRIGFIFFEQNEERMKALGIQVGEAQNFLRSLGYQCTPLDGNDGEWIASPAPMTS
jgi:FkbM family methyltransferase